MLALFLSLVGELVARACARHCFPLYFDLSFFSSLWTLDAPKTRQWSFAHPMSPQILLAYGRTYPADGNRDMSLCLLMPPNCLRIP